MQTSADSNKPQHTPGPWTAHMQKHVDGSDLGWIIEHSNGRIGWSSYATFKPNEGEGAPYAIGGANARLIAAAPAFKRALQRIWLESMGELHDDPHDRLDAIFGIARAALADFEGVEPSNLPVPDRAAVGLAEPSSLASAKES